MFDYPMTIGLLFTLMICFSGCEGEETKAIVNLPDAAPFDAGTDDAGDIAFSTACPKDFNMQFNNAHSPYLGGEESADLNVVYFSNFACSHCADFADSVDEILARRPDILSRVRIYFHHYPFDAQFNWEQHQAAAAAANQDMASFWRLHDHIYGGLRVGEYYTQAELLEYADSTLGLDRFQFNQDMDSEETISFLTWDKEQGLEAGVTGTPTVFVCGRKIAWQLLERVIDLYLD